MKTQVKTLALAVSGVAIIGALQPANAAIIQAFGIGDLSPGPFTLHDFEAGASGPGATYSSISGIVFASAAFASGGTPSGLRGLSTSGFPDPITITFDTAASSVGLFFGNDDTCCSGGFTAFMDIFDIGGQIGTIGVVANMNDFADQFLGFTSDEAVISVLVRYSSGDDDLDFDGQNNDVDSDDDNDGIFDNEDDEGGANVGLYHYIDDVQFNAAGPGGPTTVPEPVTLSLFGAGLAGIAALRRRRT